MKKVLVIEVHHKCGTVEFVEIDPDNENAAERLKYCLTHNIGGYLKVMAAGVAEI